MSVTHNNFIKLKVPEGSNGVIMKNLYLSCDPYSRILMGNKVEGTMYEPFEVGSILKGVGVGKIVDSALPDFKNGDIVWGMTGWEEYSLLSEPAFLFKCPIDLPLSYHLGVFGLTGLTAYVGINEIGGVKKGEYVFVSAASGATGHLAGQFAKLAGCYVVGSCGSQEKVDLLKNKYGFDEAFNYKEEQDLDVALKRYFPEGIDVYFDNVGGKMLDAALLNMRVRGRVVMCGSISQYNSENLVGMGIFNTVGIVYKRIRMEGFLVPDYFHLLPKYLEMAIPAIKEGKIVSSEDVANGLESAPATLLRLFSGGNVGKQVIKITDE